jgi:hypothetical protein
MQVTLTEPESEYLEGLLEKALGELREEVYHTDDPRFKDDLKAEEAILRNILAKLSAKA